MNIIKDKSRIEDAKIIQEKLLKYGYELSIAETIDFWSWVSDEYYAAGWLREDDDELFEQVVSRIDRWIHFEKRYK